MKLFKVLLIVLSYPILVLLTVLGLNLWGILGEFEITDIFNILFEINDTLYVTAEVYLFVVALIFIIKAYLRKKEVKILNLGFEGLEGENYNLKKKVERLEGEVQEASNEIIQLRNDNDSMETVVKGYENNIYIGDRVTSIKRYQASSVYSIRVGEGGLLEYQLSKTGKWFKHGEIRKLKNKGEK